MNMKKWKRYDLFNSMKIGQKTWHSITNTREVVTAGQFLSTQTNGYLVVTLGSEGTILFYQGEHITIPSINIDNIVDTTGAGDAFIGALVAQVINCEQIDLEKMKTMISLANKVGAITTTKVGALSSIPKFEDL